MKKSLIFGLVLCFVACFAYLPSTLKAEDVKKADTELSVEQQNRLALEAYETILEIASSGDRKEKLKQLEEAYYDVISKYPKAALTQETYWRLIQIYLKDYVPPAIEKAEQLRAEFLKKYPQSSVKAVIDRSVVEWYIMNSKWDKVIAFFAPAIRKSIETGKFENLYEIYMYTEAKYRLGDLIEAEKGFKIIDANFPATKEGERARQRLQEIEKQKSKNTK